MRLQAEMKTESAVKSKQHARVFRKHAQLLSNDKNVDVKVITDK